jgi:hypothetical protein
MEFRNTVIGANFLVSKWQRFEFPLHLVLWVAWVDTDSLKYLARDRVALLLDDNSPVLELGAFTGFGLKDSSPAASLIAGIDLIKLHVRITLPHCVGAVSMFS